MHRYLFIFGAFANTVSMILAALCRNLPLALTSFGLAVFCFYMAFRHA